MNILVIQHYIINTSSEDPPELDEPPEELPEELPEEPLDELLEELEELLDELPEDERELLEEDLLLLEVDVLVVPEEPDVSFEDDDTVCPLDESSLVASVLPVFVSSTVVLFVVLFTSRIIFSESVLSPNFINDDAATTQPIKTSARITPKIIF